MSKGPAKTEGTEPATNAPCLLGSPPLSLSTASPSPLPTVRSSARSERDDEPRVPFFTPAFRVRRREFVGAVRNEREKSPDTVTSLVRCVENLRIPHHPPTPAPTRDPEQCRVLALLHAIHRRTQTFGRLSLVAFSRSGRVKTASVIPDGCGMSHYDRMLLTVQQSLLLQRFRLWHFAR